MHITTEDLRQLRACAPGIRKFGELFPEGGDTDSLADEGNLGSWAWGIAFAMFPESVGWAWSRDLIPPLPESFRHLLAGRRMAYFNLRFADLRGADLRGTDLHGADLTCADLRGADLRGADLTGVTTPWTKFDGALADAHTRWPVGFDTVRRTVIIEEE